MLNTEILSTLSGIDISTIDIDRSYVDISSNTTNIIIELFLNKDAMFVINEDAPISPYRKKNTNKRIGRPRGSYKK